jgi:hypothetical protein
MTRRFITEEGPAREIQAAIYIVLFSFLSAYLLYQTTTWGAGLSPDSIIYLNGGRSILENGSLEGLGAHYPPLFYMLVALSRVIWGEGLGSLRWLQISTFILNAGLIYYVLYRCSGRSLLVPFIGSLLFISSPTVVLTHSVLWSEASFTLFAVAGLYCLAVYLSAGETRNYLYASAILIGLAFLTRYAGVALVMAGAVSILLLSASGLKKRFADSFIFTGISCILMLAWFARNLAGGEGAANREFIFHPVTAEKIRTGIGVFRKWFFVLDGSPFWLGVILSGILLLYVASFIGSKSEARKFRLVEVSFIFILIYIPFLLFSISFFDFHTPLSERILYPVYPFIIIGIVLLVQRIATRKNREILSKVLYMMFIAAIIFQFKVQGRMERKIQEDGLGFAGKEWVESDVLQWMESVNKEKNIYTNGPEVINIYLNRSCQMVPRHTDPISGRFNEEIVDQIDVMVERLTDDRGLLIYFNNIRRWYLPSVEQIAKVIPLEAVYEGKDGVVLRVESELLPEN